MSRPKIGFELERVRVPLTAIWPVRKIDNPRKTIHRYQAILNSIREVGLIEPLMVFPQKREKGNYLLMDGHLRYHALKELGEVEADCLISNEDESFTYNARISRLSPVQEHAMIVKAVKNGVTPERIATALNLKVEQVRGTLSLLEGIHPEAVELLKDKQICQSAIRLFKKVKSLRQIEMAELMVATNTFTRPYVEALLMGTAKDDLARPEASDTRAVGHGNAVVDKCSVKAEVVAIQ